MNLTSREEQFPEYSFEDWAKSLFVLNLWLPNIASGAKFQFLYTLLETSSTQLPSSNKIKTYEEFEQFAERTTKKTDGLRKSYVVEDCLFSFAICNTTSQKKVRPGRKAILAVTVWPNLTDPVSTRSGSSSRPSINSTVET
jgi:hypothetical protein